MIAGAHLFRRLWRALFAAGQFIEADHGVYGSGKTGVRLRQGAAGVNGG